MYSENKKVSYDFTDDYKNLPLNLRVKLNTTARELLEIQKKDEGSLEEAGEPGSGERDTGIRNE